MTHVVYVHGLWMPGDESLVLGRRLSQEYGLTLHSFRYSSAFSSLDTSLERLASFVRGLGANEVHFLGHSLGGLIIYRFLERFGEQPAGRAVFLGTPCVASRTAVQAARFTPVAHLMGPSVADELLQPPKRHWGHARELGIVAGTQPLGVGQLFAQFGEDNDGTVAVSETRMPGATSYITLPVSHLGMLVSARVALEAGMFLTQGRFSVDQTQDGGDALD